MAKKKSEKYIISLDAVDLGLLPTNFKHEYNNVVPLWTKSNLSMRDNDYYEFQIQNIDKNFDEQNEEEMPKIKCQICNIDVPKPFMKQHYDSFKHNVNTKIAETAIERIKKSIQYNEFTNEEAHPTVYFCPVCVAVVKVKDRINHERSYAHKCSVTIDKFLHDFYVLYSDNKNNDVSDSILDIKEINQKAKSDLANVETVSFISETDFDLSEDTINLKNNLQDYENNQSNQITNAFKNKNQNDNTRDTIEEKSRIVTTIEDNKSGDKVSKKKNKKKKAKEEINHDKPIFKDTDKENNVMVASKQENSSKITESSKTNITQKKAKKSITKSGNNDSGNEKIFEICKVCSEIVENLDDHPVCKFLLGEIEDGMNRKTKKEAIKLFKDFHYHLIMKSDQPYCMVCKSNFFGDVDVVSHLLSTDHLSKYKALLEEHFLMPLDMDTTCPVCNVTFMKKMELIHCEDIKHIIKLEKCNKILK